MHKTLYTASLFLIMTLGPALSARASSFVIDVQNPGFEDNSVFTQVCCSTPQWYNWYAPGWTVTGGDNAAGDYHPVSERREGYELFITP